MRIRGEERPDRESASSADSLCYEEIVAPILTTADILSNGIIAQFPQKSGPKQM